MIKPKMILVEGGTFMMGSEEGYEDEMPVHPVTLSSFYISALVITQTEWQAIMNLNPSEVQGGNLPVTNVSWHDIQRFLEKLNTQTGKQYRLPTEAEWEFAARGGIESKGFRYAGSHNVDEVAWHHYNCKNVQAIGQKKPNELGLYDMSGNVWEWCQDRYGEYPTTAQTNPKGPKLGFDRTVRGGSWYSVLRDCRVTDRGISPPEVRDNALGFRLAHDFDTF